MNARTPLQIAVNRYEQRNGCPFVPTRKLFYDRVGINQKRFGMLLRGELPMYGFEAKSLAQFFGVEVTELLNDEKPVRKSKSPITTV
ncbi:hypothetical protein [Runella slithyformis]|nr:hypothetical protein [Runella slithyformis]